MINCEQFIYTSAKLKREKGYQVIAKSNGVSNEILSELKNYFYPLGIKHSKFQESRSLIVLKNNKIAFSMIKNIGTGFDGRPDAIYNHTIIITKDDFEKIHNDTRVLEDYYLHNSKLIGKLPSILVSPKIIPINFKLLEKNWEILPKILVNLFKDERIAIFGIDDFKFIQNILSLVPPSLRLKSFSSLVEIPDRQSKFNFFLTTTYRLSNLDEKYIKISLNKKSSKHIGNTLLDQSIKYLFKLLFEKNENKVKTLHDSFEKIKGTDSKSIFILVTNYDQFISTKNEESKQEYADNILTVIKKIDKENARDYLEKIKKFSRNYNLLKNQLENIVSPTISLLDALIILPAKVTIELISSYVEFQKLLRKPNHSK